MENGVNVKILEKKYTWNVKRKLKIVFLSVIKSNKKWSKSSQIKVPLIKQTSNCGLNNKSITC